jgi:hypothetical protein
MIYQLKVRASILATATQLTAMERNDNWSERVQHDVSKEYSDGFLVQCYGHVRHVDVERNQIEYKFLSSLHCN